MKDEILKSGDYDKIRLYLFTESYVASKVARILRKKYGINEKTSFSDWLKILQDNHKELFEERISRLNSNDKMYISENKMDAALFVYSDIENIVTKEISALANVLRVKEHYLKGFILDYSLPEVIHMQDVHIAYKDIPIRSEGYYIKVFENTTETDVINAYRWIRTRFDFDQNARNRGIWPKNWATQTRRKQVAQNDISRCLTYIDIEHELIKLDDEKNDPDNRDYEGELVSAAIERVAGNRLVDDERFDELLPKCKNELKIIYYEISRRFHLPTPKKLRSILRLIDC